MSQNHRQQMSQKVIVLEPQTNVTEPYRKYVPEPQKKYNNRFNMSLMDGIWKFEYVKTWYLYEPVHLDRIIILLIISSLFLIQSNLHVPELHILPIEV